MINIITSPMKKFKDLYISDTEQDIIEKPSKYNSNVESPPRHIRKISHSRNFDFIKNRSFRKALSLEELDISNKLWIGYYLDVCLKRRKKFVYLSKFLFIKPIILGQFSNEIFSRLFTGYKTLFKIRRISKLLII